jgi:hypothetical protein
VLSSRVVACASYPPRVLFLGWWYDHQCGNCVCVRVPCYHARLMHLCKGSLVCPSPPSFLGSSNSSSRGGGKYTFIRGGIGRATLTASQPTVHARWGVHYGSAHTAPHAREYTLPCVCRGRTRSHIHSRKKHTHVHTCVRVCFLNISISNQARLPAELKHIIKRRKRN